MRRVPLSLCIRLLFGSRSTLIGWIWIALFSWFAVAMVDFEWEAPVDVPRTMAHINAISEETHHGTHYFVADFYFRRSTGELETGRSMSKQRPALGEHAMVLDAGHPILVGMSSVPEPPSTGLLVFTLIGFVLMSFELVHAVRTIRRLRRGHELADDDLPPGALLYDGTLADYGTWWLFALFPAVAMLGFMQALYYFFTLR